MTEKKKYLIALRQEVHDGLKALAKDYNRNIGDIVHGLLNFSRASNRIQDPEFQKRFNGLLEMCMLNAGRVAFRAGDPEDRLPFQAEDFFGDMSVQAERDPEGE